MTEGFKASTPLGDQTLDRLWDCTRRRGDMPGFAKAITAILGAMRGEDDQEFNMTRTVLSDPVLTQKVLRLANSGMYSAFGQRVSTVSKAVLVLGTEAIGHLALGLKLVEELGARSSGNSARDNSARGNSAASNHAGANQAAGSDAAALDTPDDENADENADNNAGAAGATNIDVAHIEMEKAVLAGIVARQVAYTAESQLGETAVVCSMLHTLGRMMMTFYMPERWNELQRAANADGCTVDDIAAGILGLSMEEIGHAAALHWGLPASLIQGMRKLAPTADGIAVSGSDWIAGVSTMSAMCAESLWHDDPASTDIVRQLTESYAVMLGVEPANLMYAVEQAKVVAANDLTIAPLSRPAERRARALAKTRQRAAGNKILLSGLSDMRDMLDTASPGQMVQIALETVYKGLDFSRAVAFVRNRKENHYAAKISFGDNTSDLLTALTFDDVYEPNVFHAALNSDRVIFIENARDAKFAAKLPLWWKTSLAEARSFVILPLSANGQPAGFLYGDWDDSFPPIQLSQTEFSLLNDMRTLVVRAVERRHAQEVVGSRV